MHTHDAQGYPQEPDGSEDYYQLVDTIQDILERVRAHAVFLDQRAQLYLRRNDTRFAETAIIAQNLYEDCCYRATNQLRKAYIDPRITADDLLAGK